MDPGARLRLIIWAVCGLGMAMFGAILADTLSNPSMVRRQAERSLVNQLSRELGIDIVTGEAPALAPIVDQMGKLPMPPRAMRGVRGDVLRNLVLPNLGRARDTDLPFAAAEDGLYSRLVGHGVREVRIFAMCNLLLFLATALLTLRRRSDASLYLLPAGVLTVGTLASIVIYIVGRDWFWSSLADDHAGLGYLALVSFVVLILVDILWNGARVVRPMLQFFSRLPA